MASVPERIAPEASVVLACTTLSAMMATRNTATPTLAASAVRRVSIFLISNRMSLAMALLLHMGAATLARAGGGGGVAEHVQVEVL